MPVAQGHPGAIDHLIGAHTPLFIAVFTFAALFLAVVAVSQIARARQDIRRRAIAFNPAARGSAYAGQLGVSAQGAAGAPLDLDEASELLFSIEQALSGSRDKRVSRLRRELITAGLFRGDAIFWFYAARFSLAFLFATAAYLLIVRFAPAMSLAGQAGIIVPASLLGLVVPGFYLSARQRRLRRQCRNGFPNFLDLLVVCAEGGLTPRAGIERVSREVTLSHPYLGANLFLMSLELRAGKPLVEAMENLGRRVDIDEVRSLGSLLQQTEELGTKLSDALRVFSEEMRARRLLRAEEKAHALPVKLVLPLAFFVFPVMLVVVLLPVLVRIYKAFV